MEDVIRVFQFLRQYKKTVVKFVTENPDYSKLKKLRHDWSRLYEPVDEEMDPEFPEPKGKPVVHTLYKDANLGHDLVTGRAATGIIHTLGGTMIDWYSK